MRNFDFFSEFQAADTATRAIDKASRLWVSLNFPAGLAAVPALDGPREVPRQAHAEW